MEVNPLRKLMLQAKELLAGTSREESKLLFSPFLYFSLAGFQCKFSFGAESRKRSHTSAFRAKRVVQGSSQQQNRQPRLSRVTPTARKLIGSATENNNNNRNPRIHTCAPHNNNNNNNNKGSMTAATAGSDAPTSKKRKNDEPSDIPSALPTTSSSTAPSPRAVQCAYCGFAAADLEQSLTHLREQHNTSDDTSNNNNNDTSNNRSMGRYHLFFVCVAWLARLFAFSFVCQMKPLTKHMVALVHLFLCCAC